MRLFAGDGVPADDCGCRTGVLGAAYIPCGCPYGRGASLGPLLKEDGCSLKLIAPAGRGRRLVLGVLLRVLFAPLLRVVDFGFALLRFPCLLVFVP